MTKVEPHGFAAIWNLEKNNNNNKTSGTQDKYYGTFVRSDNGDADENVHPKQRKIEFQPITS